MARTAPIFTPLEWREFGHPCQVVAAKERACRRDRRARRAGFTLSAEAFERLAERYLEMTRPAPE